MKSTGENVVLSIVIGANLEAEDSDGDTAIHLVCIQLGRLQQSVQSAGVMTLFMNIVSDVSPNDIDKAPQINKVLNDYCKLDSNSI